MGGCTPNLRDPQEFYLLNELEFYVLFAWSIFGAQDPVITVWKQREQTGDEKQIQRPNEYSLEKVVFEKEQSGILVPL